MSKKKHWSDKYVVEEEETSPMEAASKGIAAQGAGMVGGIPPVKFEEVKEPMEAVGTAAAQEFSSDFLDDILRKIDPEAGQRYTERMEYLEKTYPEITTVTRVATPSAVDIATGGVSKGMKVGKKLFDIAGRPIIQDITTQLGRTGEVDTAQTAASAAIGAGMMGLGKAGMAIAKDPMRKISYLVRNKKFYQAKADKMGIPVEDYMRQLAEKMDNKGILAGGKVQYDVNTGSFKPVSGKAGAIPPSQKEIQKRVDNAVDAELAVQKDMINRQDQLLDDWDLEAAGTKSINANTPINIDGEEMPIQEIIDQIKSKPNVNPALVDKEIARIFGESNEMVEKKFNDLFKQATKYSPEMKKNVQVFRNILGKEGFTDDAVSNAYVMLDQVSEGIQNTKKLRDVKAKLGAIYNEGKIDGKQYEELLKRARQEFEIGTTLSELSQQTGIKQLASFGEDEVRAIKDVLGQHSFIKRGANLTDVQKLKVDMYERLYGNKTGKVVLKSDQAKTYNELAKLSKKILENKGGPDLVKANQRLEDLLTIKKDVDPAAFQEVFGKSTAAEFAPTFAGATGVYTGVLRGAKSVISRPMIGAGKALEDSNLAEYLKNVGPKATPSLFTPADQQGGISREPQSAGLLGAAPMNENLQFTRNLPSLLSGTTLPRSTQGLLANKELVLAKVAQEIPMAYGQVEDVMMNFPEKLDQIVPMLMQMMPEKFDSDKYNRFDDKIIDPMMQEKARRDIFRDPRLSPTEKQRLVDQINLDGTLSTEEYK